MIGSTIFITNHLAANVHDSLNIISGYEALTIFMQVVSVCIAFTLTVFNAKERNINGFTGWFTAFIFEVCYYGSLH